MNPTIDQPKERQNSFSASVKLTRAAWRVVKLDRELLGISVLNVISNAVIFVGLCALWIWAALQLSVQHDVSATSATIEWNLPAWVYWTGVGVASLVTYIVSNFFNGAITHAAMSRFDGNDPTFREAMQAARVKAGPLVAFAGLQATVGLILNMIENRLPLAGRIAVWLVGAAWGVATMFALPVIMTTDEKNPLKVVKRSAATFTSIWKESVFVGLSLGILSIIATLLIVFVVIGLFGMALTLSSIVLGISGVAVLVLATLAFAIVFNTLHAVVMAAAYYYASTGRLPAGFDEELIRAMFRPKKKWLQV